MPGTTINSALLLLVLGNAMAVVSDVFVKVIGSGAPVFQFIFVRSLITLLLLLPFLRQLDRSGFFSGFGVHLLRSHMHLAGVFCMVIALTSLPLGTANAVFYVAPIIVMLLSAAVFREKLTVLSLLAGFSGFAGILVILRPDEFSWTAFSALGAAVALAVSAVLVRMLPAAQSTVHKLFLNYLLLLPATALLMWWEGAAPDPAILISALGSAAFILGYNTSVLLAYRTVEASRVTSAEYTGLIWAVLIGWLWFNETPDLWFALGSAMIVVPLLLIGLQQSARTGHPR
ncbi:MAG: DMT family transporter [Pseudohongiellaceae bacterium]